jgi:aspartate 1-decarboxylase
MVTFLARSKPTASPRHGFVGGAADPVRVAASRLGHACCTAIDGGAQNAYMSLAGRFRRMFPHAMLLTMMKAKLHRATVTQADLEYEGSISIDRDLLEASGILPHEQVDVLNITNGQRFTTYAIEAPRGSRTVGVNGAAARLVQAGDKVIVVAYGQLDASEARNYAPNVVLLDEGNRIKSAA